MLKTEGWDRGIILTIRATLYRFDTPPHRTVLSFCRLGLGSRRLYSNQYKAKTYLEVTSTTMFPIPECSIKGYPTILPVQH
jgi:hypothetical protein